MTPLQTGLSRARDEAWTTRFWLTQAPFIAAGEAHRRSNFQTRVRIEASDAEWMVSFECESGPPHIAPPLRAVGDPDLWQCEYVQVQLPVGAEGECLHLTITRAGQAISERFDKLRDPIAGWSAATQETPGGWNARITFPCTDEICKLRLARWMPDEGITRWPTPFGSWWHVQTRDFLEVKNDLAFHSKLDAEAEVWMAAREAGLFTASKTLDPKSTTPDEWRQKARDFLDAPLVREGDFLSHLQRRAEQQPWLAFGVLQPPDFARCRGLLENRVYIGDATLDLGPRPDWDDDHGNVYVMAHVTRFDFLADLVAAFQHSGDIAFARGAIALIESWLAENDERQSLAPLRYPMRWRSGIIVSHRLVAMMRALFSLLSAGVVSEVLLLKVFAAVREASDVLSPSLARLYPKNHSIITGSHMAQLSVLCIELRDAHSIRETFWGHLRRALDAQFLPDDVQNELSTSYHLVCYKRLTEATDVFDDAGIAVPQEITNWRQRILSVAAMYLFPNGQVAAFNDGSMGGGVDAIGKADSTLRGIILREGPTLDAREAVAIASGGQLGQAAAAISHALPYAGHFILRDGIAPHDMALAFDAGPFGLAHQHEDALSLMLVRYGKALLIDIGSGAYDEETPMRAYSTATRSHSTICIDGQDQAARAFPQQWKRTAPWENHHYFGRAVQFAHGEYSHGYGEGGAIKVIHQRAVLFVNGSYVLLIDYLLGEGARRVESHFALAPLPYEITPRGLRTTSGDGDIDVSLLYPQQAEIAFACGQNEPFAGWMPHGGYGLQPHPRLTFELETALPCCLVTLLFPFENASEIPVVSVNELEKTIECEIESCGAISSFSCSRAPLDISLTHGQTRFRAFANSNGALNFEENFAHDSEEL